MLYGDISLKDLVHFICIKKHAYIYSYIHEFIPVENVYNGTFEYQFLL